MLLLRHSSRGFGRPCSRLAIIARQRYNHAAPFSSSITESQGKVAAVVVGAGASGIATVGFLLENLKRGNVVWVDPEFRGGRINKKYREVPGNTRTGFFVAYATATEPLRQVIQGTPQPNAMTMLESLPQDDTCSLGYAGDLLQMLSDGLAKNGRIDRCHGAVASAVWDDKASRWSITIQNSSSSLETHSTPLLVYCTGSSPTVVPLPVESSTRPESLELDTALKPSLLAQFLPRDRQITVGVVGASHSAILVLMNLFNLSQASHPHLRVRWFARSPNLKYAVHKDGWILYDNTGLKGQAAQFARGQLDGEQLNASEAGKVIKRVDCSGGRVQERDAMERELPECDYVVQAVGFTKNKLPEMKGEFTFDHETGEFWDRSTGKPARGLFGAGIAFPERVVDPVGNIEYAVGFFKFAKFLKRLVPEWVAKTQP